jgi:CubicO group peptidase (beta-lactamase class C family)
MTALEPALHALEHGLLPFSKKDEPPAQMVGLRRRMADYKVPGVSVAFVYQDELAWAQGYGVAEAGGDRPVTPATIFQAASISKLVTAMLALHLVEAGHLDLDAEANTLLRTWKIPDSKYTQPGRDGAPRRVTLRGLLAHSAGLNIRGYTGYPAGRELPSLQHILNGELPANSEPVRVVQPPGKAYKYSGGGYLVVQQMIEDATGRSLADLAQEIIFDRLGMAHSSFETILPQAFLPQAASAHRPTGAPLPGKWHAYPEQAAASLWTTPSDLGRLVSEVLKSYKNESNRVLSVEMTRTMLAPHVNIGAHWDCALAFNIVNKDGMTRIGHPGWNAGFHSILLGCLEAGQGLIWMTNGENGRKLGLEISHGLAEVVRWSWW